MSRITASGRCELCGKSYRKSGMARHLQSCLTRTGWPDPPTASSSRRPRQVKGIHISVTDAYRPEYWLHLAAPASAKLVDLDDCLRATWVDCCGHLSAFDIGGEEYHSYPQYGDKGMSATLGRAVPPGTNFRYEYDFGTTTHLTLRSVDELTVPSGGIRLLARNDAPEIVCGVCGAAATRVGQSEDDWLMMTAGLCDSCAATTGEQAAYLLPVVNSPRSGMCGYEGPWGD